MNTSFKTLPWALRKTVKIGCEASSGGRPRSLAGRRSCRNLPASRPWSRRREREERREYLRGLVEEEDSRCFGLMDEVLEADEMRCWHLGQVKELLTAKDRLSTILLDDTGHS